MSQVLNGKESYASAHFLDERGCAKPVPIRSVPL